MNLNTTLAALCLAVAVLPALAEDARDDRSTIPHLDHVFVIVMENHHYFQILPSPLNPQTPFINNYALNVASLAANYSAIGHPSLTNYLEMIGGSNFGIRNDNSPDWHSSVCTPALVVGPQLEGSPNACPIAGTGMDAPTPPCDTNENFSGATCAYGGPGITNTVNYPIAAPTIGMSIADQLEAEGMSWRSYQENLPPYGADGVNNSDGLIADSYPANFAGAKFSVTTSTGTIGVPKLYAVKHNPFMYFQSVQSRPQVERLAIADFGQLFRDLAFGQAPNFSFIVPNQCHDQHARGSTEAGTGCSVDANDIIQGDVALSNIVTAIKNSSVWTKPYSHSAIVVVWDENDYTNIFYDNRVVATVDTNYRKSARTTSANLYTHFSLLKSIEAGFDLGCLNHACDKDTVLMTDLFSY